jgi:hypothetical protein
MMLGTSHILREPRSSTTFTFQADSLRLSVLHSTDCTPKLTPIDPPIHDLFSCHFPYEHHSRSVRPSPSLVCSRFLQRSILQAYTLSIVQGSNQVPAIKTLSSNYRLSTNKSLWCTFVSLRAHKRNTSKYYTSRMFHSVLDQV